MPQQPSLSRVRLVLVETQGPQNLGACARLCANFGVDDWALVRPRCAPDDPEALQFATGPSQARLRRARRFERIEDALEGCGLTVAFCGKPPGRRAPAPIELPELAELLAGGDAGRVALVFGNERTGLTTPDLLGCERACRLATTEELDSLNLSHAVAIALARVFEADPAAARAGERRPPGGARGPLRSPVAAHEEREGMYVHLRELMLALGLDRAGNPDRLLRTLRRALDRADLRSNEVRALRALCSKGLGELAARIRPPRPPRGG